MRRTQRTKGLFGWALGVLAALTLVAAAPEHVLDLDEASGPVAAAEARSSVEVEVHGLIRRVLDHAAPGHACAAHCAAHVVAGAPPPAALAPPSRAVLIWPAVSGQMLRPHPPALPERPPKA
jgi:hypothetical protein